jgi:hypothetical protein
VHRPIIDAVRARVRARHLTTACAIGRRSKAGRHHIFEVRGALSL